MVGEAVTSISHPECDGPDGISSNASMNSSYDNLMNLTMMGGDSCALDSCNSRRVDIAITLSLVVGLIMVSVPLPQYFHVYKLACFQDCHEFTQTGCNNHISLRCIDQWLYSCCSILYSHYADEESLRHQQRRCHSRPVCHTQGESN